MVVFFIDNPNDGNQGYYRIGWDIDVNGFVTNNYTTAIPVPGWFGNDTQGAGIAVADMNNGGSLDIVVFHLDDPTGGNRGFYRIGYGLDASGNVTGGWSRAIPVAGWFGDDSQGAGIAAVDINNNRVNDLVVSYIDNPDGNNRGILPSDSYAAACVRADRGSPRPPAVAMPLGVEPVWGVAVCQGVVDRCVPHAQVIARARSGDAIIAAFR